VSSGGFGTCVSDVRTRGLGAVAGRVGLTASGRARAGEMSSKTSSDGVDGRTGQGRGAGETVND
jgi:hypothetical protein